jgi:hypothetical protein
MQLVNLYVSKPLWVEVKAIAAAEDRSAASVVREAITMLLKERQYVLPAKPLPDRRPAKK